LSESADKPDSVISPPCGNDGTVISLDHALLRASSRLPAHQRAASSARFGVAPGGACQAATSLPRWWALTSPFHPCRSLRPGGLFSVALSVASLRLAVNQHPALWSPDFPPPSRFPAPAATIWRTRTPFIIVQGA